MKKTEQMLILQKKEWGNCKLMWFGFGQEKHYTHGMKWQKTATVLAAKPVCSVFEITEKKKD